MGDQRTQREDDVDPGGGANAARRSWRERVLGIVVSLVIAAVLVWAWKSYAMPALKDWIKAALRES